MSFTSRRLPGLLAAALLLAACAPLTTATEVEPRAAEQPAVDGVGTADAVAASEDRAGSEAAAQAASEQAASEQAASEQAASEQAASEEAASEAEHLAAEEAERKAEEAAAEKAAEEAEAKKAEAAAKKAAEEEAARIAAEEETRKKAEEAAKKARGVQTVLKDLGYYTGGIDGDVGPLTLEAVKDFQAVNGLQVDGKVGPNTQAVLASDDALPKPPPPPEPTRDADEPPEGGVLTVKAAQEVLRDLRYFGAKVDGKTTDSFRSALTAFQKVEGISADGSLGPQTSAHLAAPTTPTLKGGNGNRIEVDLTLQVIHVVKGGERIRTMPTSSGNGEEYDQKDGDTATALTPVGDFVIERRITGLREADLGSLYDPLYFYKGWAIHGSNSVPSYPASHGCTRVSRTDILWLADQMPNGTQVRVYGGEHTFIPIR